LKSKIAKHPARFFFSRALQKTPAVLMLSKNEKQQQQKTEKLKS